MSDLIRWLTSDFYKELYLISPLIYQISHFKSFYMHGDVV